MSRLDSWFPLHVGDYLGDTGHLTTIEHGAYLLLLMHYWRRGPLPDDDSTLATIARMQRDEWMEIAGTVRSFFCLEDDGLLHQKRSDAERAHAKEVHTKRSKAGKDGADGRWHGKRMAGPVANGWQTHKRGDSKRIATASESAAPEANKCHGKQQAAEAKQGANPQNSAENRPMANAITRACQEHLPSEGHKHSVPDGTGAVPAPDAQLPLGDHPDAPSMRTVLFRDGIPIVRKLIGGSDSGARTVLGRLLKETQDDCSRVYAALREAESLHPADPSAWLFGAVKSRCRARDRPGPTDWMHEGDSLTIDGNLE